MTLIPDGVCECVSELQRLIENIDNYIDVLDSVSCTNQELYDALYAIYLSFNEHSVLRSCYDSEDRDTIASDIETIKELTKRYVKWRTDDAATATALRPKIRLRTSGLSTFCMKTLIHNISDNCQCDKLNEIENPIL